MRTKNQGMMGKHNVQLSWLHALLLNSRVLLITPWKYESKPAEPHEAMGRAARDNMQPTCSGRIYDRKMIIKQYDATCVRQPSSLRAANCLAGGCLSIVFGRLQNMHLVSRWGTHAKTSLTHDPST